MIDLEDPTIRIESPRSQSVRDLVRLSGPAMGDDENDGAPDICVPNAAFLVARLDGEPVGCIALVDRLEFGELRRLYVSKEVRGRGIAVALVNALETAAREIGLRQVRVVEGNTAGAARAALSRLGFRPGTPNAGHWMEKSL